MSKGNILIFLLIKDLQFNILKIKRQNVHKNISNQYISTCNYDSVLDPHCPVFSVKDILEKAEPDPFERSQMLFKVFKIAMNHYILALVIQYIIIIPFFYYVFCFLHLK